MILLLPNTLQQNCVDEYLVLRYTGSPKFLYHKWIKRIDNQHLPAGLLSNQTEASILKYDRKLFSFIAERE